MRDILLDIIQHTGDTGLVSSILIEGDEDETNISAISDDRTVVIHGQLKTPNPNFVGKFGMTNLSLLKFYLTYPGYKTDAADIRTKMEERNGEAVITDICFSDGVGDSNATYRVTDHRHVSPRAQLLIKTWDMEFSPTAEKLAEFEKLCGGFGSFEKQFMPMTDKNGDLRFHIGDLNAASHKASMIMVKGVGTTYKQGSYFLIKSVSTVLKLAMIDGAEPKFSMTESVLRIVVDTPFATYTYMFPTLSRSTK